MDKVNKFKVTLLGTGTPRPKSDRYGASTLVEAGKEKFIFDCGRCTLQRLFESGTVLKQANKLFLTHLHSDHTVGIPDLWLTPWLSWPMLGITGMVLCLWQMAVSLRRLR